MNFHSKAHIQKLIRSIKLTKKSICLTKQFFINLTLNLLSQNYFYKFNFFSSKPIVQHIKLISTIYKSFSQSIFSHYEILPFVTRLSIHYYLLTLMFKFTSMEKFPIFPIALSGH